VNQWVLAAVCLAAVGYLYLTRHRRGPDDLSPSPGVHDSVAAVSHGFDSQ